MLPRRGFFRAIAAAVAGVVAAPLVKLQPSKPDVGESFCIHGDVRKNGWHFFSVWYTPDKLPSPGRYLTFASQPETLA